jgi:hypothetical protein
MRKTISSALIIASCLALALEATRAQGQTAIAMVTRSTPAEAVELERKAAQLYSEPLRYLEAARLHMRAAELREHGDPMQVQNLSMAGRLFYYTGRKAEAFRAIEAAADAAIAVGDVLNAAHLFVDASHLAHEINRREDALRLRDRARLLTKSPLLAESDRNGVATRIDSSVS